MFFLISLILISKQYSLGPHIHARWERRKSPYFFLEGEIDGVKARTGDHVSQQSHYNHSSLITSFLTCQVRLFP